VSFAIESCNTGHISVKNLFLEILLITKGSFDKIEDLTSGSLSLRKEIIKGRKVASLNSTEKSPQILHIISPAEYLTLQERSCSIAVVKNLITRTF